MLRLQGFISTFSKKWISRGSPKPQGPLSKILILRGSTKLWAPLSKILVLRGSTEPQGPLSKILILKGSTELWVPLRKTLILLLLIVTILLLMMNPPPSPSHIERIPFTEILCSSLMQQILCQIVTTLLITDQGSETHYQPWEKARHQ